MALSDYCTSPSGLATLVPCFACLTPQQRLAIKAKLMCEILNSVRGGSCDPDTLQHDAACFSCFSEEWLDIFDLALYCAISVELGARANCDVPTLVDEAKCYSCLPPRQLKAMFAKALCEWLAVYISPPA